MGGWMAAGGRGEAWEGWRAAGWYPARWRRGGAPDGLGPRASPPVRPALCPCCRSSSSRTSPSGIYALSARAAALVAAHPDGDVRVAGGEDCSMGLWMLAHRARHVEDWRLCSYQCDARAIGGLAGFGESMRW